MSNFYGTEIDISAGFGSVGNTEKNWLIMSNFRGQFFHVFPEYKGWSTPTLARTDLLCILNWGTQWTMVSYLKK